MRRGALVLCGGRSTRMGRDKGMLPIAGEETLLQVVVRRVFAVVDGDVVVVARRGQDLPPLPPGVRVVRDIVDDQGPLGGILTGLHATTAEAVFVTGCDTPFLRPAIVELLFERLGYHDVAVAETDGFLHPLCAVYRVGVREEAERLLRERRLKPILLYECVPTVRVPAAHLRRADPELRTLEGCNTPEAYEAAKARWPEEETP